MATATINDELALTIVVQQGETSVSALVTRECFVQTVYATGTQEGVSSALTIERIRVGSPTIPIVPFALTQFSGLVAGLGSVNGAKAVAGEGCALLAGDQVRVTQSDNTCSGRVVLLLSAPGAPLVASSTV